ncbi:amino acid ABC transporter permease [Devosia rhodophyticola]|uniref:Amino acid ABC transporter permease n=1 Tax=Devosia rhodophyticola TaxID=3026423 RepID=A0ABY7YU22_9HYPH|nr:amino acid ABC transporter permease [Devosia rhodophyticola]WDR04756.1 amino acid ABC transporter permease [Devosia rhodophyticola]
MYEMYQNVDFTLADLDLLWRGLQWTLLVWSASMVLGIGLGFVLGLVAHARVPVLSQLVTVFVETFRNSPLLVQLFLVFYGLPLVTPFSPGPAEAAIFTVAINTAAFTVVNLVAALDALPRGQWQAAGAFGLSYGQTMRYIVLPQAIRTALPPTMNLAVSQLQTTSLVSIIGVADLTRVGTMLYTRTLKPFLIWPAIGLIYFILAKILSVLAVRVERRLQTKNSWFQAAA